MTIGEKIKKFRLEKGMTQKELGEKCGLADSAIRRYELGGANPKIETIKRIAEALNVDVGELYENKFIIPIYVPPITPTERKKLESEILEIIEEEEELAFLNKMAAFYDILNQDGRDEAIKRVQELTEIQKYQLEYVVDTVAKAIKDAHIRIVKKDDSVD